MSAFSLFYDGLKARIGEAWPDITETNDGGGILLAEVVERIPFDENSILPFAVIHIPSWATGDWGIANDAYEPVVEIYRVQAGPEDIAAVMEKLVTLKDYLRGHPVATHVTLLPERSISTSPYVSPVARFVSKQIQAAVGRLTVKFAFAVKSV